MGVDGRHAPAAFTPGKDPVPIVQETFPLSYSFLNSV
jgi:hypothetical protein